MYIYIYINIHSRSVHAHRHAYVHVFYAAHACKYNDGLTYARVFDIACALHLPA